MLIFHFYFIFRWLADVEVVSKLKNLWLCALLALCLTFLMRELNWTAMYCQGAETLICKCSAKSVMLRKAIYSCSFADDEISSPLLFLVEPNKEQRNWETENSA